MAAKRPKNYKIVLIGYKKFLDKNYKGDPFDFFGPSARKGARAPYCDVTGKMGIF